MGFMKYLYEKITASVKQSVISYVDPMIVYECVYMP